ncbi:AbrB family transcriptional regulator [Cytobacillus gottheilii]|uniref:AbrB family transcriptional regulator n=1 Tax=Cytobacillus gottheilii TaxID=859144 RepID=A0ABX8F649_9BACI|nr:AbrB family transcriptional regulator [Cytobacillus gottheilii]QVY59915.1 AbrB family transcriptional regulator [Cytobacillus gottheilii]
MNSIKSKNIILTLSLAVLGALLFSFIGIPVPWLLGPLAATLLFSSFSKVTPVFPAKFRDISIMIIGYSMGLSFTKESMIQMGTSLPYMLTFTVVLILFCGFTAKLISKMTGIDYPSILVGSIPGGLSQILVFAEEVKGIDLTVVTFLQVTRVIMIVVTVPFLLFGPLFHQNAAESYSALSSSGMDNYLPLLIYIPAAILFTLLGKRIKSPTPYLLGPLAATALLGLTGLEGPSIPAIVLDLAQLSIGCYVGMLMKPKHLENKRKIFILAIISSIVLIGGSLLMSFGLRQILPLSAPTSFLSLAPGGMDQMAIMAHEVNADLSTVTSYQLFRIFFIYFIIPPFLKWLFRRLSQ